MWAQHREGDAGPVTHEMPHKAEPEYIRVTAIVG